MLKTYAALSALAFAVSTPAMAQGLSDFRVQSLQTNAYEVQASQIALSKSRDPQIRAYAKEAIRDHRSANVALVGGDRNYVAAQGGAMGGPIDGLIGAPLAVAGGAVGAATGAAAGVVGGTLNGGPVGGLDGLGSGARRGAAAGSRLGRADVDETAGTTVVQPSPEQQAMLSELSAAPSGARFDRLYVSQQLQAHQMAIGMTESYASSGPNPALRTYAQQVLPVLQHHYGAAQRLPGARDAM